MPARRSTRPHSTRPASKARPETVLKALPRAQNSATKKRVASLDVNVSPPAKRSKTSHPKVNGLQPLSENVPVTKRKQFSLPLPTVPDKTRPCLQLFVWGTGNFGQFGMGADFLGELSKPKKHTWVDAKIQEHAFGENFGGIEKVAAGGLHTIFIDEKGVVSGSRDLKGNAHSQVCIGLDMWPQRRRCPWPYHTEHTRSR
jgi:regulator of chromosome condensation